MSFDAAWRQRLFSKLGLSNAKRSTDPDENGPESEEHDEASNQDDEGLDEDDEELDEDDEELDEDDEGFDQDDEDAGPPSLESLRDDEPIRTMERDLLNRNRLVDTLARRIEATDTKQPLVIGLNAPWGTGKSSFLHLLSRRLQRGPQRADQSDSDPGLQPIIVEFNPWLYENVTALIRSFFAELAKKIGSRTELEDEFRDFGRKVASILAVALPGAATLASKDEDALLGEVDVTRRKRTISRELENQDGRVIVFIDDIDRLEPDITKLLFRVIRLCADFKNVTYVLAFDGSVVERHLGPDDRESGRRYIEKIIQVSYKIPRPERAVLRAILEQEIDEARRIATSEPLDRRRYDTVFARGIDVHFSTIRGIKRYVNALRLSLPIAKENVDLIDFFVIELVRVVYPEVYSWLSDNRYRLVYGDGDEDIQELLAQIRGLRELKGIPSGVRESLLDLVCDVFPLLRGDNEGANQSRRIRWIREGRACYRPSVDRHFLYTMTVAGLPDEDGTALSEEVRRAVVAEEGNDVMGIRDTLRKWARRAARRGWTKSFLGSLATLVGDKNGAQEGGLGAEGAEKVACELCTVDPEDDLRLRDQDNDGQLLGEVIHQCATHHDGWSQVEFLERVVEWGNLYTVRKALQYLSMSGKLRNYGRVGNDVEIKLGTRLGQRVLNEVDSDGFWRGYRWSDMLSANRKAINENGIDAVMERETRRIIEDGMKKAIASRVEEDTQFLELCQCLLELAAYMNVRNANEGTLEDITPSWLPKMVKKRLEKIRDGQGSDAALAGAYLIDLGMEH